MRKITLVLVMMLSCVAFGATDNSHNESAAANSSLCELVLAGSNEQLSNFVFANYVKNYEDGLGVRGFLGAAIPNTPANIEIATQHGLIWWGMKWNFAATLEEAIEHRLKARRLHEAKETTFTDVIVSGQYIIGSEEELGITFENGSIKEDVPVEKVRHLFSRGAYEIDHQGIAKFITPEHLARRVSLNGVTFHKSGHLPGAFGKNSVTQAGWVAFKLHGIHDYSTWKDTSEAQKLRKIARALADSGHTIRFNVDYDLMLQKIKKQKRTYRDQEVADDGTLVKKERVDHQANTSRYDTDSVYKSALALLEAGKGYSVGIYDGQGELIAGEIGFRDGNHLYGDSVFYDKVEHAKVAALALFEVLDAAGMPYSDPGMITPYTASMGAELVPFPEYLAKVKGGPREKIELPATWDPRGQDHLEAAMNEIAKRKNQGLGNLKITRRTPIVSGVEADAAAAKAGLERAPLNLVFVNDAAQAAAHIASTAWADMPIYVEGVSPDFVRIAQATVPGSDPATQGPTVSTLNFLRASLTGPSASGVKAYFIGSARHPDVRKAIPLKQLLDVLELNMTADAPTWRDGASAPTITVNGWGFKPTIR